MDIYDDMPDGEAQRERNQQRLAELSITDQLRKKRMSQVDFDSWSVWVDEVLDDD